MTRFVQVGVTAMRDPATGRALEAVPLYIRCEDAGKAAVNPPLETNHLIRDLAVAFGEYVDGLELIGDPEAEACLAALTETEGGDNIGE